MGKGLFLGLLTGTLVSVAGLSVVSLMAPPLAGSDIAVNAAAEPNQTVPAEPEADGVTAAGTGETTDAVSEAETEGAATSVTTEPEAETGVAEVADPADAQPDTTVIEAPAGSEFARELPDEDPVAPDAEVAPEAMDAPVVEAPAAETILDLPEVASAEVPEGQTKAPEAMPMPETTAPEALAEAPSAEQSVPVAPSGEAAAPQLERSRATDDVLVLVPNSDDAPVLPAGEVPEPATDEMAGAEPLPEPEEVPAVEPAPATDSASEVSPTDEAESDDIGTAEAETSNKPVIIGVGVDPIGSGTQTRIGANSGPQPGFSGSVNGVRINRLPSIGSDTEADESTDVAEIDVAPEAGTGGALQRFAVPVENPRSLPLLGALLIDPLTGGLPASDIASIGQPVTVAIDPTRADATERAAALRSAGLEVAILVPPLPAGATASDMEVSYQAFTQALPDAVAIIGAPDAPFQSDRRAAQHIVALLASDGRGLVTYDRGLNPARQAAESKDVPSAVVYRQLDARGESRLTMRRYLDRAAFEAARTGRVLVVAEASTEAVSALGDWVASGAKDTVVAPASAMMIPAAQQ